MSLLSTRKVKKKELQKITLKPLQPSHCKAIQNSARPKAAVSKKGKQAGRCRAWLPQCALVKADSQGNEPADLVCTRSRCWPVKSQRSSIQ